ncbi:MAG: queuosine precursor transporter [Planctomycetes bacterium]|nr:queuosine precursor transporter [Planctomycetota bacterium]
MPPQSPSGARKREVLLVALCALFIGFFVTAELLGAKLWRFTLFGLSPAKLGLSESAEFVATTGILAFPLTFVLTDVINEYFGPRIVRLFTLSAVAVNVILQAVVQAAIRVPAVSFTPGVTAEQVQDAYALALGQSWAIVAASLIAFLIGQWLDALVFTTLRRRTGGKWLWLRSQGSTVVSQLLDTFVVIGLAFVVIPTMTGSGSAWNIGQALDVSLTNYIYKFAIAVLITPMLYVVHALVTSWLGRELADAMAHEAHPRDPD